MCHLGDCALQRWSHRPWAQWLLPGLTHFGQQLINYLLFAPILSSSVGICSYYSNLHGLLWRPHIYTRLYFISNYSQSKKLAISQHTYLTFYTIHILIWLTALHVLKWTSIYIIIGTHFLLT